MNFGPNEMMMDLFRAEVESHSESLSNSLLSLERNPTETNCYDAMMRSAHSIKGAARIVRVDLAVDLAHVMEDCFVAAKRGELEIRPSDIDVLLRSVDLLVQISESTKGDSDIAGSDATSDLTNRVQDCVRRLRALREGKTLPETLPQSSSTSGQTEVILTNQVEPIPIPPPVVEERASTSPEKPNTIRKVAQFFDRNEAESVRVWLIETLRHDRAELALDLSSTTDIDPIGLAFLATARDYVRANSPATLHYRPLSVEMKVALRVTGIVKE